MGLGSLALASASSSPELTLKLASGWGVVEIVIALKDKLMKIAENHMGKHTNNERLHFHENVKNVKKF